MRPVGHDGAVLRQGSVLQQTEHTCREKPEREGKQKKKADDEFQKRVDRIKANRYLCERTAYLL